MTIQGVSINSLFNRSMALLKSPNEDTFKQVSQQGGAREAITYAATVSVAVAIIGFVMGLLAGLAIPALAPIPTAFLRLIIGAITPIGAYFIFAFVLNFMSRQQGSTRTQDEIFYTTALFTVPIVGLNAAVSAVPKLGCIWQPTAYVLTLYAIYMAYLYARSDANLSGNKPTTIALAAGGALIGFLIVIGLLDFAVVPAASAIGSCFPLLYTAGSGAELLSSCSLSLPF